MTGSDFSGTLVQLMLNPDASNGSQTHKTGKTSFEVALTTLAIIFLL